MLQRRDILRSTVGLPLAVVLANPRLAHAAAMSLTDVSIENGLGETVTAAFAVPDATPAGAVLVIHEWWPQRPDQSLHRRAGQGRFPWPWRST